MTGLLVYFKHSHKRVFLLLTLSILRNQENLLTKNEIYNLFQAFVICCTDKHFFLSFSDDDDKNNRFFGKSGDNRKCCGGD